MLLTFEISEKSFDLLKKISRIKFAEFKNPDIYNLVQLNESKLNQEEYYKNNFCLKEDILELVSYGLLEKVPYEAYDSYRISFLGRKCLKNKNF